MKIAKILTILILALAIIFSWAKVSDAAPLGNAFTYQGHLYDANHVANNTYDFKFRLYNSSVTGSQIGSDVNVPDIDVIDGYFTVELDFGSGVFDGSERWLEIGVRPGELGEPNVYTTLSPRQKITATPYALYAASGPGVSVPLILSGSFSPAIIDATNTGSGYAVMGDNSINGNFGLLGGTYGVYGQNFNSGNYGYLGGSDYGVYGNGNSNNIGVKGLSGDNIGVEGTSDNYVGIYGNSTNNMGIYGTSTNNIGVYGEHASSSNSGYLGGSLYGAYGKHDSSGNYGFLGSSGYGVYGNGNSNNIGVKGLSGNNIGVEGTSDNYVGVYGNSTNNMGIYGTSTNNIGVYGEHAPSGNFGYLGSSGYGVYGNGTSGNFGVYGTSTGGIAVYGTSTNNSAVYGTSISSYGVYGRNDNSRNFGYLGNSDYGVYGQNFSSGNFGCLGTSSYGVSGTSTSGSGVRGDSTSGNGLSGSSNSGYGVGGYSSNGSGVYGGSLSGNGVYGQSSNGYAGYFLGNVYVTNDVSALSITDRTPYPKDLATAYQAVMSMERLPDGQYQENNKEEQLDHSKLSDFICSKDGDRDLSAAVSCQNEVIKDLIKQNKELIKQNKELNKRLEVLEQKPAERMAK